MERVPSWNLNDLGLDPDLGIDVALSPLQSYLSFLRISFLLCYPSNRLGAGRGGGLRKCI